MKIKWNAQVPWGTLYLATKKLVGVLQAAWQDAQMVLFLTTIYSGQEKVTCKRRRPKNANKRIQDTWEGSYEKNLEIPTFIRDYNHHMNGVDIADQVRAAYSVARRTYRTWLPLWFYLFDTAIANCAFIWDSLGYYNRQQKHGLHGGFRRKLGAELIKRSGQKAGSFPTKVDSSQVTCNSGNSANCLLIKGPTQQYCKPCQAAERITEFIHRTPLDEVDPNRRRRAPRTLFRCGACDIAICQKAICWSTHISDINKG
jgi:hypothetical protein